MEDRVVSGLLFATGSGEQLRSSRPTPIHLLCGRPMASYVLDALAESGVSKAVVVTGPDGGRTGKRILEDSPRFPLWFVSQPVDRGDGDAALLGLSGFDEFDDDEDLLLLPADLPLLDDALISSMLSNHRRSGAACTVLTVDLPTSDHHELLSHDRVWRDRHGEVAALLPLASDNSTPAQALNAFGEEMNGPDAQSGTEEIGLGVYCVRRGLLAPSIRRTVPRETQKFHLADMISVLIESGHRVVAEKLDAFSADLIPVENRQELAEAEAELRRRTNRFWMARGVTMVDPERTYVDVTVTLGTDVTLFPGTLLQGTTVVGNGCEIGPDVRLDRCRVGANSRIEKTTATLSRIGDECHVGPFSVLVEGFELPDGTIAGPFFGGEQR